MSLTTNPLGRFDPDGLPSLAGASEEEEIAALEVELRELAGRRPIKEDRLRELRRPRMGSDFVVPVLSGVGAVILAPVVLPLVARAAPAAAPVALGRLLK